MSFDLYFYKQKDSSTTKDSVTTYLNINIPGEHTNTGQWVYENLDTGVYFYFESTGLDINKDTPTEPFENFENLNISFSLNFMRPDFFGIEAFKFVEELLQALDLFVFNPQRNIELPVREKGACLFESWQKGNKWASIDHFKGIDACFIPASVSNKLWKYNFNRFKLQEKLGKEYFFRKFSSSGIKRTTKSVQWRAGFSTYLR